MAPLQLIRAVSLLGLLVSSLAMGSPEYSCKKVKVESESVNASSEVVELCFLKDDTYFISQTCAKLDCGFGKLLKKTKAITSSSQRPGAAMCNKLHGVIEEVKVDANNLKIQRCVFVNDKVSISLNLLESWDGKKFMGPSEPIKM